MTTTPLLKKLCAPLVSLGLILSLCVPPFAYGDPAEDLNPEVPVVVDDQSNADQSDSEQPTEGSSTSVLAPVEEGTELVVDTVTSIQGINPDKVQEWFSPESPWSEEDEIPEAPAPGDCKVDDGAFAIDGLLRCTIPSEVMDKDMPVLVRPAPNGGDGAVYFLDGIPAKQSYNGWVSKGEAVQTFAQDDVTLFFPLGGVAQFYTDWAREIDSPDGIKHANWETFLTTEVPAFLNDKFNVDPQKNALVGLSMGGTAAFNLAAYHPEQFVQASSLSGYLNPSEPTMQFLIASQQEKEACLNSLDMWGGPIDELRFRNDPTFQTGRLVGMPLFVSAALGGVEPSDAPVLIDEGPVTSAGRSTFENRAYRQTITFEEAAKQSGLDITTSYPLVGGHSWPNWSKELNNARPHILSALGV